MRGGWASSSRLSLRNEMKKPPLIVRLIFEAAARGGFKSPAQFVAYVMKNHMKEIKERKPRWKPKPKTGFGTGQ
jgi:hypothetical protein